MRLRKQKKVVAVTLATAIAVSTISASASAVQYDLADPNMTVTSCFLKLGLETRDHTQIEQIKAKLTEEGFKLVSERA